MKRIRVRFTLLSMIIAVAVIAILIWIVQALLPKPITEGKRSGWPRISSFGTGTPTCLSRMGRS